MNEFDKWFEKYEEDLQFSGKSYYDSDTGHTDLEGARYDEMKTAFNAGRDSVQNPDKHNKYINRPQISIEDDPYYGVGGLDAWERLR